MTLSDEEKNELIAQLISTDAGRKWIVQQAKDAGKMKELGAAILESIQNMGDAYSEAAEKTNAHVEQDICKDCGFYHPGGTCWDS